MPSSFAAGRYEVKSFLGEGGRKRVYLARDTRLDRDVAVAMIKTEGLDADGLGRVQREAQSMGRLGDHPHIVTVFDIGDEGGQPFIVSQYMAGGDLTEVLQRADGHRLDLGEALRINNEVRRALEHAHSHGIIHRDLKPANIWLTEDGTAKLGDFGLAVALDRSRMTMEGMMVGTVAYMPPEQALGRKADARSDLYSLGCVLYEMLTGRPPFLGDDAVAVISQHINTAPVAPSWHNPQIPKALEALIMRLLAKNPDDRPDNAAAIPEAWEAIQRSASVVAEGVSEETVNPLDRLAGGVFVGREREMDELRAGVEDALSGKGRLLMLVGEPGIGKTRTSEELATYAGLRNMQVLWGRCYEGEGAPAYWPWVQLIRSHVHERDPQELMSEMGPGAAEIAEVVSEVKERLPGLPAPPTLEPEQARFRLFDSITTFMKNASSKAPTLLVLDDLHWADKPSLLLLQFMARELRGSRLLILGTYRDVELRRAHPLSQTLGELSREGLSNRVLLRGLTQGDVARFIEMTAGTEPPIALVEAVYRETEGNPFFVNEVVRLLVADGRLENPEEVTRWSVAIPQSVRDVVGRRLDHLSEECNRVLTIGSVIGREFALRTVEKVSDQSKDALLEVLAEAVGARVIADVPGSADSFTFTHALIKETLYEELSTAQRVRLHRQIGEGLEDLHSAELEAYLPQLAYHFTEAAQGGDVDKATSYATRAAAKATAQLAHEEAAAHYERALQVLQLGESPDEAERCKLLLALGEAQRRTGEAEKLKETCQQAAAIARKLGKPEALAKAALGFGAGRIELGVVDTDLIGLLEEALDAMGDEESELKARLLARLARALYWTDSRERRESLSEEAVEMARRAGDTAALAYVLNARHAALWGPEDAEGRLDAAQEIVRVADAAGHPALALQGRISLISDLLELGDISTVDREIEEAARLAEELRQPFYLWYVALLRSMRLLLEGRFDEGERMAQQALAIGQPLRHPGVLGSFGLQMFWLRREQGRMQEQEGFARAAMERNPEYPAWRAGVAYANSELGRETEAREEFERLAAHDFLDVPRDYAWLGVMLLLCETCVFLGDARRAEMLYELLRPYAGRCILGGVGAVGISLGPASRCLGVLATTMGLWQEAAGHFEDSLEMNASMGSKPWLAHTQYQYARMRLARDGDGDREAAMALLSSALDIAQELEMARLTQQALATKMELQGLGSTDIDTSIDAVASLVYEEKPDLRSQAAPDGTVTILFSDIEGSTAKTEELGDQKWMEVLREHNAIIREQVAAHDGFEVKSEGDGFMLAFQSARKALQCAIETQKAFAERADSSDVPISVRMGLHTGEMIKEGDDFFGKHVNLAARIAGQATGGEILVSSLLHELTSSGGDIEFGDARQVELKGLTGVQEMFPVSWQSA